MLDSPPGALLPLAREAAFDRRKLLSALIVLVLALLSVGGVALRQLHGRGLLHFMWQRRPLSNIELEQGKAYRSDLGTEWMSGHDKPSPALLLEDGMPVGTGNAAHDRIRSAGNGQYSFWRSQLIFSASDNSDPRTNGRSYEIYWPTPVSASIDSRLYLFTWVWSVLTAYVLASVLIPFGQRRFAGLWMWARGAYIRLNRDSVATLPVVVFGIVLISQFVDFHFCFRDPEMARTGFSILGVPFSDAKGWYDLGASLASGQGMHFAWPALRPGYGLFLALFFTWTGPSYLLAIALNLVLTALTAACLALIGERLAGRWVGLATALGFATHRLTLTYPLTLGTETLGLCCWSMAVVQLLYALHTSKKRHFLYSGIFLGLSNLARPLTLFALPLYLIGVVAPLWRTCRWRGTIARAAMLTGGLFIPLGPWLLRQWLTFGILALSSNTAEALYAATSPQYGSWSGAIYQERDLPRGIKDQYDHFQKKARANLHDHPTFYLQNVCSSYLSCFQHVCESARPHVSILGLCVILWTYLSWASSRNPGRPERLAALILGIVGALFLFACSRLAASLDLVMLLLLPFAIRPRNALIHIGGVLGAILGVALFGMAHPDPRILFVIEWAFPCTALACLHGWCLHIIRFVELLAQRPSRFLSPQSNAPATEIGRTSSRWFIALYGLVGGFVVVSGLRLVALTAMTHVGPKAPRFFTAEQAFQLVHAFNRSIPGHLSGADLQPDRVLFTFDSLEPPKSALHSAQHSRCHAKLLVLPIRIVDDPYYLPQSAVLPHWSRYFSARDYDRTVCFFQLEGVPTPKYRHYHVPVVFPGFVPRSLFSQKCALICRVNVNPEWQSTGEELLFEGIALIPIDPAQQLHFGDAYCATHLHHPREV